MRGVLALAWLFVASPARAQTFVDHVELDPIVEPAPNGFGAGVAFFDYDGDGWEDLAVGHLAGGVFLYRNGGPPDFDFTEVTLPAGLPNAMTSAVGSAGSDLDRDGDGDLVVLDYKRLRLFAWDGDRFEEVTDHALPALPWFPSMVTFADFDGDGWTDLYVDGYTLVLDFPYHECAPDMLLRNRGDGTFEDVSAQAGTTDPGCGLAALASDYDRDGDADVFTANDFGMFVGSNRLFRNDGLDADGIPTFTDVSEASGVDARLYGMGLTTADLNGDRFPDYFGTSIGRDVLLLGAPDGVFTDVTDRYGVASALGIQSWRVTWGCRFLDVENDGLWDLHVASGYLGAAPEIESYPQQPSLLYTGLDGIGPSPDEGPELGLAPSDWSRGVAVADFDEDGDDDVATAALNGQAHLYRNEVGAAPALRVHLRGTVSTPEAYGAWIRLTCEGIRREREVVVGGALASSSSPVQRMPLAGCGTGGTLTVDWPSGVSTSVSVDDATERLDLVEPEWIDLAPGLAAADGIDAVTVVVTPPGPDGLPLGPGHAVEVEATAGDVGAVVDRVDGTYEADVTTGTPGEVAISVVIDGVPMHAHPRARFYAPGGDATTIHLSPTAFVADQTEVVATVVPRDESGAPDGAGHTVVFNAIGAVQQGDVEDLGDGRYAATFLGTAGAPFQVRARVDGVVRGPVAEATEILAVDPQRSVIRLEPGWVRSDLLDGVTPVSIQVSPRDGLGDSVSGAGFLTYELVGASGPVPILDFGGRSGGVAIRVLARELVDRCPCDVVVDGVPLARSVELSTYEDESELRAAIDPSESHASPFITSAYADGQDYAWVDAQLRDAEGDIVPMSDRFSWASDRMSLVSSKTLRGGLEGKSFLRAGLEAGAANVEVTLDGEPTGVQTTVDLWDPPVRDLENDRVRTCLTPIVPAKGAGTTRIEVQPIDHHEYLLGSGYPLEVTGDGVPMTLSYDEPGTYVALLPTPATPMVVTIETHMVGTCRRSRLAVEFHDPEGFPADPDRPSCAEIEEGPCDPGDDAGPDAGDGGGDGGADAGSDDRRGSARGNGCACRAGGGVAAPALSLLFLFARRRRR